MDCPSAHGRIGGVVPDFYKRATEANYLTVNIIVIHRIGEIIQWQVFELDDKDGFGDLPYS
jgi:hypothetical protein